VAKVWAERADPVAQENALAAQLGAKQRTRHTHCTRARDARDAQSDVRTRCARDAHEMMPLVTLDVQTPPATAKGTPL